jgi:ABC-type methionine transport system permease subunit
MNEEYDANVSAITDEILEVLSSHPVVEGMPALALVMVNVFEQLAGDSDAGFSLAISSIQFFKQTLDVLEESLAKVPEGTIIQ